MDKRIYDEILGIHTVLKLREQNKIDFANVNDNSYVLKFENYTVKVFINYNIYNDNCLYISISYQHITKETIRNVYDDYEQQMKALKKIKEFI